MFPEENALINIQADNHSIKTMKTSKSKTKKNQVFFTYKSDYQA